MRNISDKRLGNISDTGIMSVTWVMPVMMMELFSEIWVVSVVMTVKFGTIICTTFCY